MLTFYILHSEQNFVVFETLFHLMATNIWLIRELQSLHIPKKFSAFILFWISFSNNHIVIL